MIRCATAEARIKCSRTVKMQRHHKYYITRGDSKKMLRTGAAQQQANFILCIRQKTSVTVNISFFQLLVYLHLKYSLHSLRKHISERKTSKCQAQENHHLYITSWILDRQLFVNEENKLLCKRKHIFGDLQRSALKWCKKSPKLKIKETSSTYRTIVENEQIIPRCPVSAPLMERYCMHFSLQDVWICHPRTAERPPAYLMVSCFNRAFQRTPIWVENLSDNLMEYS